MSKSLSAGGDGSGKRKRRDVLLPRVFWAEVSVIMEAVRERDERQRYNSETPPPPLTLRLDSSLKDMDL